METNRLASFFGLTSKNPSAQANDKTAVGKSGGFADMLFGAMSQRADSYALGQAQIQAQLKAVSNTTTASWRSGRGLPATRLDAVANNDRPVAPHERRAERAEISKNNDGSTAKVDQAPDAHPSTPVQTGHKHESGSKVGCGDQKPGDVTDADPLDSAEQVDAASETEATDDPQDAGLGTDDGNSDSGTTQDGDQNADQQAGAAAINATVKVDDIPVTEEIVAAAIAPAAPADTAEASAPDIAAAAALAAATPLPEIGGIAAGTAGALPSIDPTTAEDDQLPAAKPGITFAATAALNTASDLDAVSSDGQKGGLKVENDRDLDDPDNLFRRSASNARKAAASGQGTTAGAHPGAQNNTAQAAQEMHAAATSGASNSTAGTVAPLGSVAPVGFDSGLGTTAGLPGWNLHLAQGSAIRRGDFVANLRQHLQNLPVHDQVALSIQRSVRDGTGSITLQLSPVELGRIHLKLDIDEENNVQASIMVERPSTLDLLQKDTKALERALQEAGLKAGPGDLSFSLQGGDPEAFARDFGSGNGTGSGGNGLASDDGADDAASSTVAPVIDTADGWVDVQV